MIRSVFLIIALAAPVFAATAVINTSSLQNGPFTIDFQLTSGSGTAGNNTVTLTNFAFGGGSLNTTPTSTTGGAASGSSPVMVTLTNSSFYNDIQFSITPGSSLTFDYSYTSNADSIAPDSFTVAIFDKSGNEIPTSNPNGFNTFFELDLPTSTSGVATITSGATNVVPSAPVLSSPANGATEVSLTPSLVWTTSPSATSYDVYFGTSSTPPFVLNTTSLSYTPGTLAAGTTYYWQVVAKNMTGSAPSGIWSFVTMPNSNVCNYQLSAAGANVSLIARSTSITVTTGTGCAWTASSNSPWLTITSGGAGTGSGTVDYSIAANPGAAVRSGSITAAGKTFMVTQLGTAPFSVGAYKNGQWFLPAGMTTFGLPGDLPVVGDWNGNGTLKIGVFRPSTQMWYLDSNGNGVYDPGVDIAGQFGIPGDLPVVGDWTGSGTTKVGIFRPSVGLWALDMNGNASWDSSDVYGYFGLPGDTPVVGDWTGSGTTKVGIFRSSNGIWALDNDGNLAWDQPADTYGSFGFAGDTPVVGDWTGSGTTKVGIFRSSNGIWALDNNGNLAWDLPDTYGSFGFANDTPVAGDWTGNGKAKAGIYRPSAGLWALDIDGNLAWSAPDTDGYRGPVGATPVVVR